MQKDKKRYRREELKSYIIIVNKRSVPLFTINMICKLDEINEVMLLLDTKYLIGDTGIELAHGKFKILGVVYEKIGEDTSINLARDSMLGMLKKEEIKALYDSMNGEIGNKLNVPTIKTEIKGPTIGILPIGIYL